MQNEQLKGISILICCYNSSWIIERCLRNLLLQKVENLPLEIIVVDNNSTDNTSEIAHRILDQSETEHQIIFEPTPGVLYARLTGMKVARYKYTIFCDDDNLLDEHYSQKMFDYMEQHPEIGCCGGRGIAECECEPDTIVKKNLSLYAIGSQKENIKGNFLFGAGLCLRSNVTKQICQNHHFYLVGRCGSLLLSGEDNEIVKSIILKGYSINYNDDCTFVHVLRAKRLNKAYFFNMVKGLGIANPVLSIYGCVLEDKSPLILIKDLATSLKSVFRYSFSGKKKRQNNEFVKVYNLRIGTLIGFRHFGLIKLLKIYRELKSE